MEILKMWFVGHEFHASLQENGKKMYVILEEQMLSKPKFRQFKFIELENFTKEILEYVELPEDIYEQLVKTYEYAIWKKIQKEEKEGYKKDWWIKI